MFVCVQYQWEIFNVESVEFCGFTQIIRMISPEFESCWGFFIFTFFLVKCCEIWNFENSESILIIVIFYPHECWQVSHTTLTANQSFTVHTLWPLYINNWVFKKACIAIAFVLHVCTVVNLQGIEQDRLYYILSKVFFIHQKFN